MCDLQYERKTNGIKKFSNLLTGFNNISKNNFRDNMIIFKGKFWLKLVQVNQVLIDASPLYFTLGKRFIGNAQN